MAGGWVNIDTGEEFGGTVDNPPDFNAEWWDDLPSLPGGPEIVEQYLARLTDFDADAARADFVLSRAKKHYAERVRRINAERQRMKYNCLADVQSQVKIDIEAQRGKAKSKHYDNGTCGTRRSTKTIITDESAARFWATIHCKEAIVRVQPKFLKSRIPKDAEVPGLQRVTEDSFFATGG